MRRLVTAALREMRRKGQLLTTLSTLPIAGFVHTRSPKPVNSVASGRWGIPGVDGDAAAYVFSEPNWARWASVTIGSPVKAAHLDSHEGGLAQVASRCSCERISPTEPRSGQRLSSR